MSSTISKFGSSRGNYKYAFPLFHIFYVHRTPPMVFIAETEKTIFKRSFRYRVPKIDFPKLPFFKYLGLNIYCVCIKK